MLRQILSFFNKTDMEAGMAGEFFIGESLVGDGNEIAHIDLIIGSKIRTGWSGLHPGALPQLRRLLQPACRGHAEPPRQARHLALQQSHDQRCQAGGADVRPGPGGGGPCGNGQRGLGRHRQEQANDLCILVGVFIHWQAESDKKIYDYNYQATKESIQRALQSKPTIDEVLQSYKAARHPFASGAEG